MHFFAIASLAIILVYVLKFFKPSEVKPIFGSELGSNGKKSLVLTDRDANHHTLIVGTTGSGKTTTVCNILQHCILSEYPVFYVDGKGDHDLCNRVERFAKEHNRPFYKFSMTGKSHAYNPIASGGYSAKKDRIIALRHWSEEYYKKIAEAYLQGVFAVLDKYNILVDLPTLNKYLDLEELFILARQKKDQKVLDRLNKIKTDYTEISGLKSEIDILINSEIGHLFDCKNEHITLSEAYKENAVVYFCLSPLQFPNYANMLGKVIINDLKSLAAQNLSTVNPKYTYCILDEFSIFADDQVINLINQGRSAKFCCVMATQALADLTKYQGKVLLEQIISNTNNFVFQRQNNPVDAMLAADIIGTKRQYNAEFFMESDSLTQKISPEYEHKVMPEAIKYLNKGQGYYLSKSSGELMFLQMKKGLI